jgi:hypothetical protein
MRVCGLGFALMAQHFLLAGHGCEYAAVSHIKSIWLHVMGVAISSLLLPNTTYSTGSHLSYCVCMYYVCMSCVLLHCVLHVLCAVATSMCYAVPRVVCLSSAVTLPQVAKSGTQVQVHSSTRVPSTLSVASPLRRAVLCT